MNRSGAAFAFSLLLLCSCMTPEEGAPFFWSFDVLPDNQFKYVAQSNFDFPDNTDTGEKTRINFLNDHLKRTGICPNGYTVLNRELEHKFGRHASSYRSITYIGQCRV